MTAPDILSGGGLDDIPSFGDPEHEARVDAEMVKRAAHYEAMAAEAQRVDYERTLVAAVISNERADVGAFLPAARRVPIETDPAPQAQSSVQIEDAAKGDPRVTTKLYAGSPLTDAMLDAALEAHAYVHRMAAEMAMKGWQQTVGQMRGELS